MKKVIYLLALAAALSLTFTSCKDKKDSDDEHTDDMDAVTLVVSPAPLA